MIDLPKHIWQVINIGFVTAWIGILIGLLFSFIIPDNKLRAKGIMMGFVSGIMIAIITIDIIPESVAQGSPYLSFIGVTGGLILAVLLDGFFSSKTLRPIVRKGNTGFQAALLLAVAMGFDSLPGGIALGSIYTISLPKAFEMSSVFILHGIPEGLSIGLLLRESNVTAVTLVIFTILTSLPMAVGSFIGGVISGISTAIISICLSFASGLILYITFREIIPKTRELWSGRLSSVGSVMGLLTGILTMLALH